jgi:transketolase
MTHYRSKVDEGAKIESDWNATFETYKSKYPAEAAVFESTVLKQEINQDVHTALVDCAKNIGKPLSTRQISEKMLNAIAPVLPQFVGGSADLAGSNLTIMQGYGNFLKESPEGRNLRFGVREAGMGNIGNAIALSGYGLIPYIATFFVFTDYMRSPLRMSALSQSGTIIVATHDSVFLGEDGPTHQPIEHCASLRAMPNMQVSFTRHVRVLDDV